MLDAEPSPLFFFFSLINIVFVDVHFGLPNKHCVYRCLLFPDETCLINVKLKTPTALLT